MHEDGWRLEDGVANCGVLEGGGRLNPLAQLGNELLGPGGVIASDDVLSSFTHQTQVESEVVDGAYLQSQYLFGAD